MRLAPPPGKSSTFDGDQMVRDEIANQAEPERRELREHLALVRDARAEDVVEGGDAIGRDDQQLVAEIVDVAHLAASGKCESGKLRLEYD